LKNIADVQLVAVCEKQADCLAVAGKLPALPESSRFLSDAAFFAKGKLADICIVSTQDRDHRGHAIQAMQTGYDILLKKPIAATEADCREILQTAQKLRKRVFVCHVLRYSPFFSHIKRELDTGLYGDVSTINLTENVAYWHYANSYIRGNWRNSDIASPMIIAKCCHDLDILAWYVGQPADSRAKCPFTCILRYRFR
jgi:predicted dehydrogenase